MSLNVYPLYNNMMTLTGRKLLSLMPKSTLSKLDTLVREVLQNSLDAVIPGKESVIVDFITGKFNSPSLTSLLDNTSDGISKLVKSKECDFIAIKDVNCVGLTGELNPAKVKPAEVQNENLFNLVYDALNPKLVGGAGGSWGVGKTMYYKMGIGLVLFYSRVKTNENTFEERLAGSLVEDESKDYTIFSTGNKEYPYDNYTGIAFFGETYEEGKTRPITNSSKIKQILDVFNITPYSYQETGTTIIIPYIDKQDLLSESHDIEKLTYWDKDLESKLSLLIQKWYFTRINNREFIGPYLCPLVNGKEINQSNMVPTFNVFQQLYNLTINEDNVPNFENSDVLIIENINIKGFTPHVGTFVCCKLSKKDFKMDPPDNEPSPYDYIDYNYEGFDNLPIIMYMRKPGMVVSYDVGISKWVKDGVLSNPDEFLVGIFRLNYESVTQTGYSIEEYFRESEKSDHFGWEDHIKGKKYLHYIQTNVRKIINEKYGPQKEEAKAKISTNLSKMLGKLFLPPESFGTSPSDEDDRGRGTTFAKPGYNIKFLNPVYTADSILFQVNLKTKKIFKCIRLEWVVATTQKNYSRKEWEGMSLEFPLEILHLGVNINKINNVEFKGKNPWMKFFSNGSSFEIDQKFSIVSIDDADGRNYGIEISTTSEQDINTYDIDIYIKFKIKNNLYNTSIIVKTE